MSLKGGPELKARLKAIRLAFKPIGRKWAEGTADAARPMVPVLTGRLRASFKVRNATQRKAVVGGHYTAYFVDAGSKAHAILPRKAKALRFESGGRTVFSRKVDKPRIAARPFRARAAHESLRRHPMAETLIAEWNRVA